MTVASRQPSVVSENAEAKRMIEESLLWQLATILVVLSRIKNPSESYFTKGDCYLECLSLEI